MSVNSTAAARRDDPLELPLLLFFEQFRVKYNRTIPAHRILLFCKFLPLYPILFHKVFPGISQLYQFIQPHDTLGIFGDFIPCFLSLIYLGFQCCYSNF